MSGVLLSVEVAVSEEPLLPQTELHQPGQRQEDGGGGAGVQLVTEGQSGEVEGSHPSKHHKYLVNQLAFLQLQTPMLLLRVSLACAFYELFNQLLLLIYIYVNSSRDRECCVEQVLTSQ